jgi:aminotransferase
MIHRESEGMNFIAERAKIHSSATVGIMDQVKKLRRAGEDVISLSAGEPDFVTPEHIRDYAKQALDQGYTFYSDTPGLIELREAIADKLRRDNDIEANPEGEILVTVGGKEAIYCAMMATINPGDEVIVPDPYWVSYVPCLELCGGRPVYLPLDESAGFRISASQVEKAVTTRTKMLILNSPNNPTGSVVTRADLDALADLAKRKHFLVLSDELYEKILFDGERHYSIASFAGMKDLSISVNGFSKATAMPGWRLGYLAAPKSITARVATIHSHLVTGACTFAQRAAALALRDERTEKSIKEMVSEYQLRRDIVMDALKQIDGISCCSPKGTFYAFPNMSAYEMKSQELASELLNKAKVAVVPGAAFGVRNESFIRLSFATAKEKLKTALDRMQEIMPTFQKRKGP